jgi:O-6-methylguanine DNA methyltransferase
MNQPRGKGTRIRVPKNHCTSPATATPVSAAHHQRTPFQKQSPPTIKAAVGKNPISFVVPCHRVLGKSGGLCGYHWGLTRKQAIIGWEAGLIESGNTDA